MAMSNQASRRQLLQAGLTGFTGLTLPGLYRARAEAAATTKNQETAIILVWLRGGQSHLDTFDMKPQATADYRGAYSMRGFLTYVTDLKMFAHSNNNPSRAFFRGLLCSLDIEKRTFGWYKSGAVSSLMI